MSEPSQPGVLYTEHVRLRANTPLASLWSYETRRRERGRPPVVTTASGDQEYWLDGSDPLLNTILPGTAVSVIVNVGDRWASGGSLIAAELMPRLCVVGPFTQPRLLRVGKAVRAVGAVLPAAFSRLFGIEASELVDRIVPLDDLWPRSAVDGLLADLSSLDGPSGASSLRDELVARAARDGAADAVGWIASRLITRRAGRISVDDLAETHGLTRQQFARRFRASTGLPPKQFARISRFQALVHALLSSGVSEWALVAPALGFYDQAHMINEFRAFAGCSPTVFFRPHDETIDVERIRISGRPYEWLQPKPGS